MTKQLILCLTLLISLVACNNKNETANELFSQIYSEENVAVQPFSFDAERDTVLKGKSGTVLTIPKNTFVDSLGNAITGQIQLELKEVFSTVDIVLSNLTTTSNGKPLQTGGMIYLNARSNGKQLQIADTKKIDVKVPTAKAQEGMQVYEGVRDSSGINWLNPVPLNQPNRMLDSLGEVTEEDVMNKVERTTNIMYHVDDAQGNQTHDYPEAIDDLVSDIAWQGDGLKLKKDSIFKVDSFTVTLVKQKKLQADISYQAAPRKGRNTFSQDNNTSYLFSVKKLGWANIDRLFDDPRSTEVELITNIDNQSEFDVIYTTMVTEQMFLPGYQMKNNSFSFTHDDYEKPVLPVGAKASIMATAYKKDKAYFSIQEITIAKAQTVALHLNETTKEDLKKQLEKSL
jgi:hypothetical protein